MDSDDTIESGAADAPGFAELEVPPTVRGVDLTDGPLPDDSAPQIEGYELLGKLGQGGMGVVWEAKQLSTNRLVAIKVLRQAALRSEWVRIRFQRELDVMARLEHPHIARVYHGGKTIDGAWHYVMERVAGLPLDRYVKSRQLNSTEIVQLCRTVCEGVQYAHQSGVIHRDLKPGNILVDNEGKPRVLDFGLAKLITDSASEPGVTIEGHVAGTPSYMSPEQAAGLNSQVDTRSDVYSLGVILFQLLTGQYPHDPNGSQYEVIRRIVEQDPKRLSAVLPTAKRDLEAIICKALSKSQDNRYPVAGGLAADLRRFLDGDSVEARRPRLRDLIIRRIKRHKALVVTACGIGLAVLVLLVGSYAKIKIERDEAQDAHQQEFNAKRQAEWRKGFAERQTQLALVAKKEAEDARSEAVRMRLQAEEARKEAQRLAREAAESQHVAEEGRRLAKAQLATFLTDAGQERLDDPNLPLALLWFTESLKVQSELKDDEGEKLARIRICTTYRALRHQLLSTRPRETRPIKPPLMGGKPGLANTVTYLSNNPLGPSFTHQFRVTCADISHDAEHVVTAGPDNVVCVWDVADRSEKPHPAELKVKAPVRLVRFSPDGQIVLVVTVDRGVRMWDWNANKTSTLVHDAEVLTAEFDASGKRVVTAGMDQIVRIWDARTTQSLQTFRQSDWVWFASFSPSGDRLLTAFGEKSAAVWDLASGKQIGPNLPNEMSLGYPEWDKAGARVLTRSQESAWVLDVASGRRIGPFARPGACCAAISPDGSQVAVGGNREAGVARWEIGTEKPFGLPMVHGDSIRCVAFSPDGKSIASGSNDNQCRLWNAATGEPLTRPLQHNRDVRLIAFSPDSRLIATAELRTVRVWDVKTGQVLSPPMGFDVEIVSLQFAPDGSGVLGYGKERSARWLDLATVNRSIDDLTRIARYFAKKRIDRTGGAIPLSDEEVQQLWKWFRLNYPDESEGLGPSPSPSAG